MNTSKDIQEDRTSASELPNNELHSEATKNENLCKSLLRRIRYTKRVRLKATPVRTHK